jgi:hypothetical protein
MSTFVQEDDHRRHFHLPRQQHVLPCLRHRSVRCRHHQDRPVHLCRTGDHVLDVVPVSRTVHVGVVAVLRLVFHVGDGDRDASLAFFRSVVDLVERPKVRPALQGQRLGDRRRQRRLAVVDVSNRAHIHVRFPAYKFLFAHSFRFLN